MLCLSLVLALGLTAALVPALAFGLVLALADSVNSTGFCISSDSVPSSGSDSVSGNKIALTLMTDYMLTQQSHTDANRRGFDQFWFFPWLWTCSCSALVLALRGLR